MADITDKTEATEPLNILIKLTEDQLKMSRFSAFLSTSCIENIASEAEDERSGLKLWPDTELSLDFSYKCLKYDGFGRIVVDYRPIGSKPGEDGSLNIRLYERRPPRKRSSDTYVNSRSVSDYVAYKKTGKTIDVVNWLPVATQNYEESLETQLGVLFEMLNNDLYPVVTGEEVFTLDIPKKDWREGY